MDQPSRDAVNALVTRYIAEWQSFAVAAPNFILVQCGAASFFYELTALADCFQIQVSCVFCWIYSLCKVLLVTRGSNVISSKMEICWVAVPGGHIR